MPVSESNSTPRIKCTCSRCGHTWESEKAASSPPIACPACKSTYWNRERREVKAKEVVEPSKPKPLGVAIKDAPKLLAPRDDKPALKVMSKEEFLKLSKKK